MKKFIFTILASILVSVNAVTAKDLITSTHIENIVDTTTISHSGRTDSAGCHNDYKRGTYHCH